MIHVVATIEVVSGKRAEFLSAFHQLVPLVRAEVGCIEYGPTVEIETTIAPAPPRPDVVVVIEKWDSLAALQDHLAAPHMAEFRQTNGQLIQSVKIQVLQTA